MVFDTRRAHAGDDGGSAGRATGRDSVLLLTRDAGFAEIAELDFTHTSGPVLFGSRVPLLNEWRAKLAVADSDASVFSDDRREGF